MAKKGKAKTKGKLQTLTSSLLSRVDFFTRLGIRFDGKRDFYKIFGYKRQLLFQDYVGKYLRQDISKRIVNAPVSATWRTPPVITVEGQESFDEEWTKLVKKHKIWKQMERVDKLAGIGNYAVLLLGINDGRDMDVPINPRDSNDLLYLQPYSQPNAEIMELEEDPTNERFGMPKKYRITASSPLTTLGSAVVSKSAQRTIKQQQFMVHHSRIVHVAEDTLESNFLGIPRLEAVFNLLDDLLKVTGGTSETFWLAGNKGMQVDIDKDTELTPDDAAALSDELEDYQHQLRRFIRTRGVKIKDLGGETPNPKEIFNMLIALISGATGIPRRILTGSEAGQLASDQDRANWSDRIVERRINFAEPSIITPTVVQMSAAGIITTVEPENITYNWPSNFQMTPLENAQTMAQKARAAVNYSKQFKEHPIMTVEEARATLDLDEKIPSDLQKMIDDNLAREEEAATSAREPVSDDDRGEDDPDEANGRPGQSNGPDDQNNS